MLIRILILVLKYVCFISSCRRRDDFTAVMSALGDMIPMPREDKRDHVKKTTVQETCQMIVVKRVNRWHDMSNCQTRWDVEVASLTVKKNMVYT